MMRFFGQNAVYKKHSTSWTKKAVIFLLCLPIAHITLATQAIAEEINIEISGNGSESTNVSNIASENTTTVTQNNEANIINNVLTDVNTGNNSANLNSGENTSTLTGDADSEISVVNNNINSNNTNINPCCNQQTSASISGNGSNSANYINGSSNQTTVLNQNNKATINNNITVKANTGFNKANSNSGDVTIITGSIKSVILISNKNINNNVGEIVNGVGNSNASIKGNGAYSDNPLNFENTKRVEINKKNEANIENNVYEILNTGNNYAVGNFGDVVISTGNIENYVRIENENINSNTTVVTCDCNEKEVPFEPKPTPSMPHTPGHSVVQGASGSSSDGGPASGNGLPVTGIGGSSSALYLITLVLLMMFLSGLYLRFHSGNAPPEVA